MRQRGIFVIKHADQYAFSGRIERLITRVLGNAGSFLLTSCRTHAEMRINI